MSRSIRRIPFARPRTGAAEIRAVRRVLRSGWLTSAGEARAFEEELSEVLQVPHCVLCSSATAALHLSALAMEPRPRVVVVPVWTFTASAATMRHAGAELRFVDSAPDSYHPDPMSVARTADSEGADAVMAVNMGGAAGPTWDLHEVLEGRIPVIEDAAHSLSGSYGPGRAQGSAAQVAAWSFYATKTITTGEGGLLGTPDPELATRARMLRLHGIDREVWQRADGRSRAWDYDILADGYKYNLPDLLAAIGRVQLSRAQKMRAQRQQIARLYLEAIRGEDWIDPPPHSDDPGHSWHLFAPRLRLERLRIDRDEFLQAMGRAGIGTSVHYRPLHRMTFWKQTYGLNPGSFPNAEAHWARSFSLPVWQGMGMRRAWRVAEVLLDVGRRARR